MIELSGEQTRQLIDAQQAFGGLREARAALLRFKGGMRWRRVKGIDYLLRAIDGKESSNGPRSAETEAQFAGFVDVRNQWRERRDAIKRRLATMRPINVAYRIGRVPETAAKIIDALDREGLLDGRVRIVGTNALFAYEVACGVQLNSGLIATGDLDVLVDANTGLQIAAPNGIDLAKLLKRADRSFRLDYGEFARNDEGYEVDILRPDEHNMPLLAGRPFDAVAVSERGNPVFLSVPRPKAMAKHKRWLSRLDDRNPAKRPRDKAQAEAIEHLLRKYRFERAR